VWIERPSELISGHSGAKMKRELMEILACPVCKGELQLKVETEEGDEVIKGSLLCSRCNEVYPIDDAIPNLLPPQMRT
jgi:uncharacterized protein YbaR (Trm112 family)